MPYRAQTYGRRFVRSADFSGNSSVPLLRRLARDSREAVSDHEYRYGPNSGVKAMTWPAIYI
jgi:hypothetical protein